jgi:hypothetical protein
MTTYKRGSYNQDGWSFGLGASMTLNANTGRDPTLFGLFGGGITMSAFSQYHGGSSRLLTPSFGARFNYHHDFYGTGINGPEFVLSGKMNLNFDLVGQFVEGSGRPITFDHYGYGPVSGPNARKSTTRFALGTNFYLGLGAMSEFNQQTGLMEFEHNRFLFRYENDGGIPFNSLKLLSDGDDKYRTAALTACLAERCTFVNLFTGRRDKESFAIEEQQRNDPSTPSNGPYRDYTDEFGYRYKYGLVDEKPNRGYGVRDPKHYRYSTWTFSLDGGNRRFGLDTEQVNYWWQNLGAHNITKQPAFKQYSRTWGGTQQWYSNSHDGFSLW